MTQAIGWLVDNLDRPHVVTNGCARLGPALDGLGVSPEQAAPLAQILVDTLRANAGVLWRPDQHAAWQETGRLVARWIEQGAAAAAYQPPYWTGTVVDHDRRRQDLAVLLVRTFLPYPYECGQYALVESPHHPESWRRCWIATPTASDNTLELHVRSDPADRVGLALVGRSVAGDQLRIGPAGGALTLPAWDDRSGAGRDLLLVADDTGIAPVKALLTELRRRENRGVDPGTDQGRYQGDVRLVWLVPPNEDPYDLPAVSALAAGRVAVSVVRSMAELSTELSAALTAGDPPVDRDVYVAGSQAGGAAALALLAFAGVPAERIRYADIGHDG